ncbi:MAG TPA: hypothetical protein VGE98_04675, partial [Thermoanaerobaculia bacterium]
LLLLEEGLTHEVRELSARLVTLFQAREVEREALAAAMIYDQAVREDTVGIALTERLLRYLREAGPCPVTPFDRGRRNGTD